MIPPFMPNGNLPAGIHITTWSEFEMRFGVTAHRQKLLEGLALAINNLALAGCLEIFIDGSFVTAELHPNDFDACWNPDCVSSKLIDPVLIDFSKKAAL